MSTGNDDDGEDKPIAPVKTVDKAATRTTKRTAEPQAPAAPTRGTGNRRGGPRGNEAGRSDLHAIKSLREASNSYRSEGETLMDFVNSFPRPWCR